MSVFALAAANEEALIPVRAHGGGHLPGCARDHVLPGVCAGAPKLPGADDALREVAFAWPLLSTESRDLIVRCVRVRATIDAGGEHG